MIRRVLNRLLDLTASYWSDERFLKLKFRLRMGYTPNLENPKTYSEKLQWLKLHDRNPRYPDLVDKVESKKRVAELIGEKYIIPTLGVWDKFDQIDFSALPSQFVLKCTHDSGGVVICKDKEKLDMARTKRTLDKALGRCYYPGNREWPYKNLTPRIIAEKYMVDESGYELKDYKFFCFHGEVKALFIATDRSVDTRFDFFDRDFNLLPFVQGHPRADKTPVKPKGYDEMIRLAQILAKDIPHARIDFYDINGQIYFGEITFFHYSGMVPFEPEEWDYKFGEWLELPKPQQ